MATAAWCASRGEDVDSASVKDANGAVGDEEDPRNSSDARSGVPRIDRMPPGTSASTSGECVNRASLSSRWCRRPPLRAARHAAEAGPKSSGCREPGLSTPRLVRM
jgi:hypothetical protein